MNISTPIARPRDSAAGIVAQRREFPHLAGFWIVAAAYFTLSAFGTAPTPLWPLYEEQDHFGPLTVTVAFATMVVGIALTLTFVGHLSDRLGRRRVIVPALGVGVAAAIVLTVSSSLAGLLVGRFLTGMAIGLMAATATAYLSDLYRQARPGATRSGVPGVVAGVASLGGLALGPVVSGSIAQITAKPLSVSYALFGIMMLIFLGLALATPETVDRRAQFSQRPARFSLNPTSRRQFIAASSVGFFAFGVSGLFSSLGAIIIRNQLGLTSVFVGGLGTFVVFAASAISQIVLRRLGPRSMMIVGSALFPVGLALTVIALLHPALWLFLVAAAIAGAGAGLLFKSGLGESAIAANPESRAGVLAVFFIISYLGMGIPSILFALTTRSVPLVTTMMWFASILTTATIVAVVVGTWRSPQNPGRDQKGPSTAESATTV
jgi:MFS family permease